MSRLGRNKNADLRTASLQVHLEQPADGALRGWRSVFGQARREEVEPVEAVVTAEFEDVEPDEWP